MLVVCIPAATPAQITPPRPQGQAINLNFQDVDLAYLFSALAQQAGINIVHSNLPVRTVTLRTFQPVAIADIVGLIHSLAAAHNISVVEGNGFLRLTGMGEVPTAPDLRQVFVYRLRHARAPELASTLSQLFGFGAVGNTRPNTPQTLSQQIMTLQNPPAQQVRPPQVVVGNIPGLQGQVLIVPDEATNSLLIRATAPDFQVIQQTIQGLDVRPLQVVIEVVIAEVRRQDALNFGVQVSAIDTQGRTGNETSAQLPQPENPDNFSLTIIRTGDINVAATLTALATNGNVRILSRPVIQAQNNQQAEISVGEERPFVQISRTLPTDQAVRDEVVQYREVATTLSITPTINPDGYVNLAIVQEVNKASNEVQFGAPILSTRSATTQLFARDGQTIVIGGLMDEQEEKVRSGIPFLKDIPILGALFGSTRNNRIQSELFLFLTPHIVATDADADRIRQEIEMNTKMLDSIRPIRPLVRPIIRPDSIRR
jgi:general secretion pathway protein D